MKKKQDKQRLVLDCRRTNALFRRCPGNDTGAAEALQRLEFQPGETLFQGSPDIKNCFYQCGIEEDLSAYFCFEDLLSLADILKVSGGAVRS